MTGGCKIIRPYECLCNYRHLNANSPEVPLNYFLTLKQRHTGMKQYFFLEGSPLQRHFDLVGFFEILFLGVCTSLGERHLIDVTWLGHEQIRPKASNSYNGSLWLFDSFLRCICLSHLFWSEKAILTRVVSCANTFSRPKMFSKTPVLRSPLIWT